MTRARLAVLVAVFHAGASAAAQQVTRPAAPARSEPAAPQEPALPQAEPPSPERAAAPTPGAPVMSLGARWFDLMNATVYGASIRVPSNSPWLSGI